MLDVLIVEDERSVARAAALALSLRQLEYTEVFDIKQAKAALGNERFRVVLTDLKLPGESGFDLLEEVGKLESGPVVITISGFATADNAIESFRRGAFDFLPKPFDVDELWAVVSRALRCESQGKAAAKGLSQEVLSKQTYGLGSHSWARLEADNVAVLGVGSWLSECIDTVVSVEFLAPEERSASGHWLCELHTEDDLVHRVWAPLSGTITEFNRALEKAPNLVQSDPYEAGWLVRIATSNLEEEVRSLVEMRSS